MNAKFKIGDNVKLINCKNGYKNGLVGIVVDAIPVFKDSKEAEESRYTGKFSVGEGTSGYYKVQVGSQKLAGYATDSHLELDK